MLQIDVEHDEDDAGVSSCEESREVRIKEFSMLPFIIYFVTGVVTGFHLYTLLSLVVYGVPLNPLELIALLGSLCLLIAAYVSLFRPRAAAHLALIALLAIWCFYGPAIARIVRNKLAQSTVISSENVLADNSTLRPLPSTATSFSVTTIQGRLLSPVNRVGPE